MEWKLLTQADQVTTTWSGGTTTQLAIAPEVRCMLTGISCGG